MRLGHRGTHRRVVDRTRRPLAAALRIGVVAAIVGASLAVVPSVVQAPVQADPYSTPQSYSAAADSYITSFTAGAVGLDANLTVTNSLATANSVANSHADVRLIQGSLAGVTVPLTSSSQDAPPDHTSPSVSGLSNFGLPGVLTMDGLAGTALARGYASACPAPTVTPQADTDLAKFTQAPGHPPVFASGSRLLSKSIGKMAGMTVLGGTLGDAGAFTNYDVTSLTPINGAADSFGIQSTSTSRRGCWRSRPDWCCSAAY